MDQFSQLEIYTRIPDFSVSYHAKEYLLSLYLSIKLFPSKKEQ